MGTTVAAPHGRSRCPGSGGSHVATNLSHASVPTVVVKALAAETVSVMPDSIAASARRKPVGRCEMYDRDLLWSTLTGFTRTIVGPYDANTMLEDLTEAATALLRLVGCGVSLIHDGRLTNATSIPPALSSLELAQERTQSGPCVQASRTGEVTAVPDLTLRAQSWGVYCAAGAEAGVLAVAGIPMKLGDSIVGALNLYAAGVREWSDDDLAIAQVLADMATGYLINVSQLSKQQQLNEQLQHALDSRVIIEQAKGMVAATHRISVETAFDLIRGHARGRNASLRSVAEAIVHLGLRMDADKNHPAAAPERP